MPRSLEPATADEAASIVAAAARANERVFVRGSGTKSDPPAVTGSDVLLSTVRLNRVVAHRHGDLTATIEAGATLASVNRALAEHGQSIPLDPPWSDRATVGGIVATNDSGPRRHRYGSPRDLIIGVELARADGVRAKAGGIVVKNVAGYDLSRLMTGSFGCLGVILTATFKLYPLPAASRTVVAALPSAAAAGPLLSAIAASQLTPTAVELEGPPFRALVRFESTDASVVEQSAKAARLADGVRAQATIVADDDERREWQAHDERIWKAPGAVVKVTLVPSELPQVLDAASRALAGGHVAVVGRAALGVLLMRVEGEPAQQAQVVRALRDRCPPGRGGVVLLRASEELKAAVGVWGPMGDAFRLMQAVKRSFDPQGILNPGAGPGGL